MLPNAIEEAINKRKTKTFLRLSGIIGGEEFRTMPLLTRSGRRLSWLSMNIVLNIIAASVIAMYQDTLAAVITLAVFLPMVSDMSGCSGNQAVAVSMRELSLGLVRPGELFWVLAKEAKVGIHQRHRTGPAAWRCRLFMEGKSLARNRCRRRTGSQHPGFRHPWRHAPSGAQKVKTRPGPGIQSTADDSH